MMTELIIIAYFVCLLNIIYCGLKEKWKYIPPLTVIVVIITFFMYSFLILEGYL